MDLQTAINTFIEGANEIKAKHTADNGYSWGSYAERRKMRANAKFQAIDNIETRQRDGKTTRTTRGVYCFIALVDGQSKSLGAYRRGDILKPANYRRPAPHARGNVFDDNNGLGGVTAYGPIYLR